MTLRPPFARFTAWSAAVVALAAVASVPAQAQTIPQFPALDSARAVQQRCDQGLARAKTGQARLLKLAVGPGWLRQQDRFMAGLEDDYGPVMFLSAVHPDKAVREASEACELRWNSYLATLSQDMGLYRAVTRLKPADDIDRELVQRLLEGFEDSGVSLKPAERRQAKDLTERVGALGQTFGRNIRDDASTVAFTESELAGVPPAVWQSAKRDAQGRVLLGISTPEYTPVMDLAEQGPTRERMWRTRTNQGGQPNLGVLAEIVQLRQQYARLLGTDSWADFVLRRKMAQSPARAQAFLGEVKAAVAEREVAELAELRQAKAEHLKQPLEATRLERWDVAFYTERVRQARYQLDQEAFRKHFPPEASLAWALRLVERLLGVRYERLMDAKAWHPEVHTYLVRDAASNRPLGTMLVDLYPREGKYNHAAVWPLRGSATHLNRLTQTALVVNLDRKGLSMDELETLLHELGHAVHGNLSLTRYQQQAGTSVLPDFVEAPSQMLEDWVYQPEALALMAEVCPSCTPLPAELLAQAQRGRHYGKGVFTARQQLYASYDLALYGPQPQDPLALWSRMEGATPLGHVPGTIFPAGFGHIASHYGAGYYGYLWSLVVAADLRTAFAGKRMDPLVGRRYRDDILAQGGQQPPQKLVHDFLGRDFNAKAFFDELKK